MKTYIRRFFSLLLALAVLSSCTGAFASEVLGELLYENYTPLHQGTEYVKNVFWNERVEGLEEENYVVYTPNSQVRPAVSFGSSVLERLTTIAAAGRIQADGSTRVIAGTNGDFFGVTSGMPLGCTMTDGVLRNATNENYAVGFRADGTAMLGAPQLSMVFSVDYTSDLTLGAPASSAAEDGTEDIAAAPERPASFSIAALNCVRNSDFGIYLFNRDFNRNHTIGATESGVNVICRAVDGRPSIGETLTLCVEEVFPDALNADVGEGQYILSSNHKAGDAYNAPLLALRKGDTLTLKITAADEKWNDAVTMLGALFPLLWDGEVQSGLDTTRAPRTAIGQRADGSVIFYTIDGRQRGASVGTSLVQVANRLKELGCVDALTLDGGGSTTFVASLPTENGVAILNTPSDGSPCPVTNSVFLTADNTATSQLIGVSLALDTDTVLTGASVTVHAVALDSAYLPMPDPVSLTADAGTFSDNTFTAPDTPCDVTVTARCGSYTQSKLLHVIAAPDELICRSGNKTVTALELSMNATAELSAQAIYRHRALVDPQLEWTVIGDIGTFEGGTFHAASYGGNGSLQLRCGTRTLTIPVRVIGLPRLMADNFESADALPEASDTVQVSARTDAVFRGTASARLTFTAAEGKASCALPRTVPEGYTHLQFALLGDGGSGSLVFETNSGSTAAVPLAPTEWKTYALPLPDGTTSLTALRIEGAESGSLTLDALVLSPDSVIDTDAPAIDGFFPTDPENAVFRAMVTDSLDAAALPTPYVALDGKVIPCTYDEGGNLAATLPALADNAMHRLTVVACDGSGNLTRECYDLPSGEIAPAFADTEGHWANGYIACLKSAGISNGDGSGFAPDRSLTRQEFAVLLCRYLNLKTDANAVLPAFADRDAIADWASESVLAVCAAGLMQGGETDGKLLFRPNDPISRQEAATVLARLFPQGFNTFGLKLTDADEIAPWALDAVKLLSSLWVISGYDDGAFHPNDSLTRGQVAAIFYRMQ